MPQGNQTKVIYLSAIRSKTPGSSPMKTTPQPPVQPGFCIISKTVRIALGLSVATLLGLPLGLEAQSNCVAAPPNMVSWWRAEGNALDQTGANNGTTSGNVTFVSGRVGQPFFVHGIAPVLQSANPARL